MNVGSLFSGIGGFDLGLERAGMHTKWFCEQDAYCRRVLAKHWPGVPCYDDIRTLRGSDVEPVDLLCGGFPCQDLSSAGKQAGLDGERSRLWYEYLRVIREVRPEYVIVENVPRLRKYLGVVLGGLAEAGYDAEWDCIRASDFGAPHQRNRLWIVGYANGASPHPHASPGSPREATGESSSRGRVPELADAQRQGELQPQGTLREVGRRPRDSRRPRSGPDMADAQSVGQREPDHQARTVTRQGTREGASRGSERGGSGEWPSAWELEPDVGRVANGVPARVDRLRALGNALVPQIAEWIGYRIIQYHYETLEV